MAQPAKTWTTLALALAVEVAAVATLRFAPGSVSGPSSASSVAVWVAAVGPVDVVWWLARPVVGAAAVWLLLTTTLGVVAGLLAPGSNAAHIVERVSLPMVRRLCESATAMVMVGTAVGLPVPAGAVEPPMPPPVTSDAGDELPEVAPTPPARSEARLPEPALPQPLPRHAHRTATVQPGDNLWRLAAAHLASTRGVAEDQLSNRDIALVWRDVIRINRPRLRSGNPDLIHPGEQVLLPGS